MIDIALKKCVHMVSRKKVILLMHVKYETVASTTDDKKPRRSVGLANYECAICLMALTPPLVLVKNKLVHIV